MVEDNKIAVLRLEAGEEVQEDVDKAERVEEYAGENEPRRSVGACAELSVERIHERCVKEQCIKRKCHERVPIKPICGVWNI